MKDKNDLYNWIGEKIATLRQEKGMSQTQLANLIDLSRGSIANIEKGRQQVSLHILWKISEKLEISIDSFLPLNNEHLNNNSFEILINQTPVNQNSKDKLSKFLGKL